MLTSAAHLIRPATTSDARRLNRLAQLDSARPLTGAVLLAEQHDRPVAAISLADGRTIADPFRPSAPAQALLRAHAHALGASACTPSRRERLSTALNALRLVAA